MTDETRVVIYGLWALFSVLAWGKVLVDRFTSHRRWHDARSRRELVTAVGLFVVAFGACLSLILFIAGAPLADLRGVALAASLGSFLAVGAWIGTLGARQQRSSKYGRRIGDKA